MWFLLSKCLRRSDFLALIYLEAESHDLASQTVSSEESLHGVSQLHLFGEHIPEQLVKQVSGVEQRHQNPGQLILQMTQANSYYPFQPWYPMTQSSI